jgi:hypothetical protein
MKDHEYRKLQRNFTITWFLLGLVMFIFILTLAFHNPPHQYVAGSQGPKGDTGTGIQGVQGEQGFPGRDGLTEVKETTQVIREPAPTQTPVTVIAEPGKDGKDGEDGQPGPSGRELEQQFNKETCAFEQRYVGDDLWTPILELAPNPVIVQAFGCEAQGGEE